MKKQLIFFTLLAFVFVLGCTTDGTLSQNNTSSNKLGYVFVDDFIGEHALNAHRHVQQSEVYSGDIEVGMAFGYPWGYGYDVDKLPFNTYENDMESIGGYVAFQESGSSRTANVSVYLNDKLYSPQDGVVSAKEWVNHLYGREVKIHFDASKDDQTNKPKARGTSGVSVSGILSYPYGWSSASDFLPASDTSLYVPYPIRWLEGEQENVVTYRDKPIIDKDLLVRWNVDPKNDQGVFIVINCPKQIGDTYPEIKNTPETIIPIEVDDADGSFLLERKHFKNIPKHAQITIMLARGRYAQIRDKYTNDTYSLQFRSSAVRPFYLEY